MTTFSDRDLLLTGWIGERPDTGRDLAHLLLTPRTSSVDPADMARLAAQLGLSPATAGPPVEVEDELSYVLIDRPLIYLVLYDVDDRISRPVDDEWIRAAKSGTVMLTCGLQPWTGTTIAELDAYLPRATLYMGLLSAREDPTTSLGSRRP
ncbi:hypothetical protein SAMN05421630_115147 [Prauserella marina]|uniref:Uncharacterized protein n=1 Tax=Prauserella marina TaxID=530584 RepID=A0A1G6Z658_9PSEU|nr:hypothetical protein [Prauserella marina]PWV71416.1 hypothetical protein DES30_112132 [Prauserella marina]SDD98159.1 hypothetical protein SAMN05421630_115147 [Prauserella marina]